MHKLNIRLNKRAINNKGFSLVELSIVLAIIGVLGVGSTMLYSEQSSHAKWKESQAKLKVVKAALLKFAEVNKYMPCPDAVGLGDDSRTVKSGTIPAIPATVAVSAIPKTNTAPTIPGVLAFAGQAPIPNINVSTCTTDTGTVPYKAIGLTKADVEDSWGNLFEYAVDQGVTHADNMLNCPTDTACFFNGDPKPSLPNPTDVLPGSVLPAFNLSTQPLKNGLGPNNLTIFNNSTLSVTESEGLVAVLVALNENGAKNLGLDDSEAENKDGDTNFVNDVYSESPYYDDSVLGIAANEIKTRHENEPAEIVLSTTTTGPVKQTANDILSLGDNQVGTSGTNIGTDAAIKNAVNDTFDFGADAAGKEIVLTLNTHAAGSWIQERSWAGATSDHAAIEVNDTVVKDFNYDFNDNNNDGLELVTFTSAVNSSYVGIFNSDGSKDNRRFSVGQEVTTYVQTWDESHEFIVLADENGVVKLDLSVQTTATMETVDFKDIELTYYDTPPDMPSFPSVLPIDGIDESQGLE